MDEFIAVTRLTGGDLTGDLTGEFDMDEDIAVICLTGYLTGGFTSVAFDWGVSFEWGKASQSLLLSPSLSLSSLLLSSLLLSSLLLSLSLSKRARPTPT